MLASPRRKRSADGKVQLTGVLDIGWFTWFKRHSVHMVWLAQLCKRHGSGSATGRPKSPAHDLERDPRVPLALATSLSYMYITHERGF